MSDDGIQSNLGEDLSLVVPYLPTRLLRDHVGQALMRAAHQLARTELHDFGRPSRQVPRKPSLECVGGLDDVIIDRNDGVHDLARLWIAEKVRCVAFDDC